MAEYIEREAAKEELVSWARCINYPKYLLTEDAMCVLDGMKAADVVEVVYGRWIPTPEYDSCWCSCCKKQYTGFFASGWNYCPNCGARMDGDVG